MSRFIDGPAAGEFLTLHRAPFLLRVVQSTKGFDALDQIDDEPRPDETITVYVCISEPAIIHVNRGSAKRNFWMQSSDYRVLIEQPSRDMVATIEGWQNWCKESAPTILRKMIDTLAETERERMQALIKATGL